MFEGANCSGQATLIDRSLAPVRHMMKRILGTRRWFDDRPGAARAGGASVAAFLVGLAVAACGGGEGAVRKVESVTAGSTFMANGRVMDREPLVAAQVDLQCRGTSYSTTTNASADYNIVMDATDLHLPCLARATSADGAIVLYGVLNRTDRSTANITPLTDLILSSASGQNSPAAFSGFQAAPDQVPVWLEDLNRFSQATQTVAALMGLEFSIDPDPLPVSKPTLTNPLNSLFLADGVLELQVRAAYRKLDFEAWTLPSLRDKLAQNGP